MSRRAAALVVAASIAVLLLAFWAFRRPARAPGAAVAPAVEGAAPAAPATTRWNARLHLPAANGHLGIAEIAIESASEPRARLAAVVAALVAAEPVEGLSPLFPEPVRVRGVMLTAEGTAYVDLAGAEGGEPPPGGSAAELQRVYGVVHTVLDNVPEAARVVLLWNGVQRRSLGGHVDTGHPLSRFAPLEPSRAAARAAATPEAEAAP